ncbi:hypothetical protein J2W55_000772 [Mucilaginibacter pocheonensis]|uniref:Uncharacterized protein n=1 Tax=Mucilaginibacter pocheonensis TaxID=398050 RepID=A0ABU1T6C9_9SPHI|nr:hypothetical protein [Mucilaginibacter pocheonensis]
MFLLAQYEAITASPSVSTDYYSKAKRTETCAGKEEL